MNYQVHIIDWLMFHWFKVIEEAWSLLIWTAYSNRKLPNVAELRGSLGIPD